VLHYFAYIRYIFFLTKTDEYDDEPGIDIGFVASPGIAFDEEGEFRHNYIGYAVKDINSDGVPELLIMTDFPSVLSLFTLKDNEPVHLDSYWSRYYGRFAAGGTIYVSAIFNSGGTVCSFELKPGATVLTALTEYSFKVDFDGEGFSYEIAGDERILTDDEFQAWLEQYTNPPNPMPLTFIPIEQ